MCLSPGNYTRKNWIVLVGSYIILRFAEKVLIMPALCNLPLLPSGIYLSSSSIHSARRRFVRLAVYLLVLFWAGILLEGGAGAQYIPPASGPVCESAGTAACPGSRSSSTESDEDRSARQEAAAEARAERQAEKDRQKAIKDAQKRAKQEEAQRLAESAHELALANERIATERAAEVERQRLLAIETQRLQTAFDNAKPGAVSGLKGMDSGPGGTSTSGGLGLKDLDDTPRGGAQPAWTTAITDPQVAPIARHLASVVPPLPISQEEAKLSFGKIYLNDDRLLNTTDYVLAGWEMAGLIADSSVLLKFFMIGGKTLIAGENGAYMYVLRKDKDYDAALAYLKNPAQAQAFAHMVEDVRQNRPLPANADPAMAQAARAVNDPSLNNDNKQILWDTMTSPEALSAMLRKVSLEAAAEYISHGAEPGTNKLLETQQERKEMFDGIRLERTEARKMMELATTTEVQRAQYKAVIEKADQLSANCFKFEKTVDRVVNTADSVAIGDATDRLAKVIRGDEAKGREY